MVTEKDFEELGFTLLPDEWSGGIARYELGSIYISINLHSGLMVISNSDMVGMINFKGKVNDVEELSHLIASINADNKLRYELND